ncbi:MAG: TonB-dependent receptor [Lentisphaeria bacterium]|nr:TonB-dependent receptor [Lentisphaeria bacterium]
MLKKGAKALLLGLIFPAFLFAGTTGKISGLVTDADSGEPLIGVNVVVSELGTGAATGLDGRYIILNVPPGIYEVRFSMIGYTQHNVEGVRVMVDLTTTLDAQLGTSIIEGEAVTVTADRSMVQADITYSQSNISASDLSAMPVEEFEEVISLQAGVVQGTGGEIHIRGGRSSEVGYMVDGISVTDPYTASMAIEVENNAIQELQLISGTFNAEYGQAMSGIINIVTREGDMKKYGGNIDFRIGRYASTDPKIYFGSLPDSMYAKTGADNINLLGVGEGFTPTLLNDIQGSINGPIPGMNGKASFYLSGRYYRGDGYLYGIRQFNPESYTWSVSNSQAVPNTEYYLDYEDIGIDNCTDEFEDGMGGCSPSPTNLGDDPNGDNWHSLFNPGGTEANYRWDEGEMGNGVWDGGDYIQYFGDNVLYDVASGEWFRDMDHNGIYIDGTDWFVTDSLTFVDANGNGVIDGEIFYDTNGDGAWSSDFGDGNAVPMSPTHQISLQGKVAFKLGNHMKLSVNTIYSTTRSEGYSHKWKFNPDGRASSFRDNMNVSLSLQHNLSPSTFYTLKASSVVNMTRGYLFDIFDVNWSGILLKNVFSPFISKSDMLTDFGFPGESNVVNTQLQQYAVSGDIFTASSGYKYYLGGISSGQSQRMTHTNVYKADMTSQVNDIHQFRLGVEYRQNAILSRSFSILYDPNGQFTTPTIIWPSVEPTSGSFDQLLKFPWEMAAYLQDKIELQDMIVNAGLRFEVFEPDGGVLKDPADPNPRDPLKLVNKYFDLDGSGTITANEAVADNAKTLEDRLEYWFIPAKKKYQLSPRVAIAYPITDEGALHFSYGHFFQIPPYSYLYANPDFEVARGSGIGTTLGNADLEPQRTVQYEVGLQQQLSENIGIDITGFYKDIRNLLGSKIVDTFSAGDSYALYINRDYGNTRGVTVALRKRMSDGLAANIDYTFSLAQGNASDPASAYFDANNGIEPEKQLVFLDWDQRHTVNGSVTFGLPYDFNTSFIGSYGSGLPYTPSFAGERTSFENSERRPAQVNVDMRVTKSFRMIGTQWTFNLNVYNVLDRRNEVVVYSDTGRSGYSLIPTYTPEDQGVNSLSDYLYRPDYYSAPRQIRIGLSAAF